MSTLKQLVDETTNIKNELKTCHTNLKSNLIEKGVECSDTDKLLSLVGKVGEIETFNSNSQLLDTITLPGLLELDGAINSHDTFEITNTDYVFTRNIGKYTFNGSETFIAGGTNTTGKSRIRLSNITDAKGVANNDDIGNLAIENYATVSSGNSGTYGCINGISIATDGKIFIYDENIQTTSGMATQLTNKTLYYELATPQVITIPKKHLAVVDLGSLDWTKESYTYGGQSVYRFKAQVSGIKVITSASVIQNLYCEKYMTDTANHSFQQASDKIIALDANGYVVVNDSSYSTADDFKNAVQGQYLFYETEDEVSDFDNVAQINADGIITSNSEVLPNVNFEIKCK